MFAALGWRRLRVITGDYLAFTQVDAVWQLLGWSQPDESNAADGTPPAGKLRVGVVQTTHADGAERAFHPKAALSNGGGGELMVEDKTYVRNATADFASTTLLDMSAAGEPTPGLTLRGYPYGIVPVR